jgi:hypothetical protein
VRPAQLKAVDQRIRVTLHVVYSLSRNDAIRHLSNPVVPPLIREGGERECAGSSLDTHSQWLSRSLTSPRDDGKRFVHDNSASRKRAEE